MFCAKTIPTEDCQSCELQEICDMVYVSMNGSPVTCEVFKNKVYEYGGKDKLLKEIFNKIVSFEVMQDATKSERK